MKTEKTFHVGRNLSFRFARPAVNIPCVCLFLILLLFINCPAQDGPPVPPRVGFPIDSYKFIDTNWTSTLGYSPRSFFGIEGVSGWSTNLAMRIAGAGPAWLQYNYVENDSRTNIMFPEGAISFWVRPATWSSTNIEGGTGPGVPARLLELGAYSEQGNWGWFSLFLDEAGSVLSLGVQSNQFTAVPIQAPISWASNEWHTVALNYTLTNIELFLDGSLAVSATNGLPFWPSYGVLLTNGFFIGSDSSGSNIANADFEHLRIYDYAMLGSSFSAQYDRVLTNYLQEGMGPSMPSGSGLATESPESPESLLSGGVRLQIQKTGTNSFYLYLTNLISGTQYLLADKLQIKRDIRSQWSPSLLFTASSSGLTLIGNFIRTNDFFSIWDWDAYQGPIVWITSPASNSVLSGKVKVSGEVSDIFPDRIAELYVDGDYVLAVTNGPMDFDLDTQLFTNGVHVMDVVARTISLDQDGSEFANVAEISVTFSNFLTAIDTAPFFSGTSPVLKFSTAGGAQYRLDIYNDSTNLLRTYQGTNSGGAFQITWDMRDGNGYSVPGEAGYIFKMTTVATGGGSGFAPAGTTNQVTFRSFAEGAFNAGQSFVLRCKRTNSGVDSADEDLMDYIYNYIWYADLLGPDPAGTRGVLNDDVFLWDSNDDKSWILYYLKQRDVGHVIWSGHAFQDGFGYGPDTVITVNISSSEIKGLLTNNYNVVNNTYDFRNPKRYVDLDGCVTGNGDFPMAFGILKMNTDRRPNIARRSFVGWTTIITFGWYGFTRYQNYIDALNDFWTNVDGTPYTILEARAEARAYVNYQINVNENALYGSRLLTWAVNAP